jgi:hypothetical protein
VPEKKRNKQTNKQVADYSILILRARSKTKQRIFMTASDKSRDDFGGAALAVHCARL